MKKILALLTLTSGFVAPMSLNSVSCSLYKYDKLGFDLSTWNFGPTGIINNEITTKTIMASYHYVNDEYDAHPPDSSMTENPDGTIVEKNLFLFGLKRSVENVQQLHDGSNTYAQSDKYGHNYNDYCWVNLPVLFDENLFEYELRAKDYDSPILDGIKGHVYNESNLRIVMDNIHDLLIVSFSIDNLPQHIDEINPNRSGKKENIVYGPIFDMTSSSETSGAPTLAIPFKVKVEVNDTKSDSSEQPKLINPYINSKDFTQVFYSWSAI